jgi:hypothetical protein
MSAAMAYAYVDEAVEDDFEWVNAWAAARQPLNAVAAPKPAEGQPTHSTVSAEAGEAAVADPPIVASASPEPADLATFSLTPPAEPESPGRVPEAAQPSSETLVLVPVDHDATAEPVAAMGEAETAAALGEATALADHPEATEPAPIPLFEAARRLGRARWHNIFRLVARVNEPPAALPESPLEAVEPLQEIAAAEATLAPDQLERDIIEIEMVRDRLFAEHTAVARQRRRASARRTSDSVPILVGAALAFTLLVVFGAAASFVSLR